MNIAQKSRAHLAVAGAVLLVFAGCATKNVGIRSAGPRGIDVSVYGAVGDGVCDDTAAIRAAMFAEKVVIFSAPIYKISSVEVYCISGLRVIATNCEFRCSTSNAFRFKECSNIAWDNGRIVINTTQANPNEFPFELTKSSSIELTGLYVDASAAHELAPIAMRHVNNVVITGCYIRGGGDNSIWALASKSIVVESCKIERGFGGRHICLQQVSGGIVHKNTIVNSRGDGISIHGSSNVVVSENIINGLTPDPVLQTARGISVEPDENAALEPPSGSGSLKQAIADLESLNDVFSRNVMITRNTISHIKGYAMALGGNVIAMPSNRVGNIGRAWIVKNTFYDCDAGILAGDSSEYIISHNIFEEMKLFGVLIDASAVWGAITLPFTQRAEIYANDFRNVNRAHLGYAAIHFTDPRQAYTGFKVEKNLISGGAALSNNTRHSGE